MQCPRQQGPRETSLGETGTVDKQEQKATKGNAEPALLLLSCAPNAKDACRLDLQNYTRDVFDVIAKTVVPLSAAVKTRPLNRPAAMRERRCIALYYLFEFAISLVKEVERLTRKTLQARQKK